MCIEILISRWRIGLASEAPPRNSTAWSIWQLGETSRRIILRDIFFYLIINSLDIKIWVSVKCLKLWLWNLCGLPTDCFSQSSRIVIFKLPQWSQWPGLMCREQWELQEKAPALLLPVIYRSIALFIKHIRCTCNLFY